MKIQDMSKLALELCGAFYGGVHSDDNASGDWQKCADYVRKLVEQAADVAHRYVCHQFCLKPSGLMGLKEAILDVIPKDEPLSPFGCRCWKWVNSEWVRPTDIKYIHIDIRMDAKHCEMCGKPRV